MTQPSIDFAKFIQSVESRMNGSVLGYSFVLGNAATGSPASSKFVHGSARVGANGANAVPVTTSTQFDIASCSKFLTGIAAVQLLQGSDYGFAPQNALGDGLDQPMWRALPQGWQVNQAVKLITYRHLLTHKAGLVPEGYGEPSEDWVSLKAYLTNPNLELTTFGTAKYSNLGFGLFRLLLPTLNGMKDDAAWSDDVRAKNFATAYEELIQTRVFGAVGAHGASTNPPANCAFSYAYPVTAPGYDPATYRYPGQDIPGGGLWLCAGAGCWSVSADQIAPVLESIAKNDGRILSTLQWLVMQGKEAPPNVPTGGLGLDMLTDDWSPGNTGFRWVEKNGGADGFASSIAFFGAPAGDPNYPAASYWASLFINSNIGGPAQLPGWNWCKNCGTLFYAANANNGIGGACPASKAGHDGTESATYLVTQVDQVSEQVGWKQCAKCLALCYEPSPGLPSCCAQDGKAHSCPGPTYDLVKADRDTLEWQSGWRWCNQCGVLALPGSADACKNGARNGGKHNFTASGKYSCEMVVGPDTVLMEAFRASVT
jgi:CubicO group peptidase (beta-lactamase class C family)